MQAIPPTEPSAKKSQSTKSKARAPSKKRSKSTETLHLKSNPEMVPAAVDFAQLIATAAYYRAEQRGFAPGYELQDWLEAEREIRDQLEN